MKQPDFDTLKSITQLENGINWDQFCEYLRDARDDAVQDLYRVPADQLQDARAEARVLDELVRAIDTASDEIQATEIERPTTGIPE